MRWIAALSSAALLAACTGSPVAVCPAPVVYTPEEQKAASDELRAIQEPCMLCRFMVDYAQERARLRACQ